jgi:murein DD-endopeptidase MepM/ murein hydrolase activator NlpD
LPERRRRHPRPPDARPLSRAVAHLAVVGLVAFSAAFGFSQLQHIGSVPAAGSFNVVATARGGSDAAPELRSAHFALQPQPSVADPILSRRVLPTPTPTPTPTPEPSHTAQPMVYAGGYVKGNGQLLWPVPGGVITQYFWSGHLAIDIAAPTGNPVLAADGGIVVWAGWRNDGGGLVVEIDHGNGMHTGYNHLGVISVTVGQTVTRGQRIASVGCTGLCTGPHVHFQVIINGVLVNPLRYL